MALQTLRKGASGWIAKLFLVLLVFSFLIWGIADVFRGMSASNVATVGKTDIPQELFRQNYLDQIQQIGQRAGRGITPDEARAFGLDKRVLSQMIADATLDEQANRLGLAIGNDDIARLIQENPAYRPPGAAAFDPNYFAQLLRSNGFTEQRFVTAEKQRMLRQQLVQTYGAGLEAPKVLVQALERYEGEARNVAYVLVTPEAASPLPAPTEQQLKDYFEAHKITFRAPEYRTLAVLALTPQDLSAKIEVSDEDAHVAYENEKGRFGVPEKRDVHQIIFTKPEDAAAAAEKIKAGASFADIAAEQGLKDGDTSLGLIEQSQILDPAIGNAAFGLGQGETSGAVEGRFGTAILHVRQIQPGSIRSFEEVKPQLVHELALRRAEARLLDEHDAVEDERASGSTLTEIAQKQKLKLTTIEAVDRAGRTPDGAALELPGAAQVVAEAFETQPGVETDTVQLPQNAGFVWFEVVSVTPARDRTFEEAKEAVTARWTEEETLKAVEARAKAMLAQVQGGTPLAQVAGEAHLPLQIASGLRRGRADGNFPAGTISQVFETQQDGFGEGPAATAPARVVFEVKTIIMPQVSAEEDQRLAQELSTQMENDLLQSYLASLQKEIGVQINDRALAQAVGAPAN